MPPFIHSRLHKDTGRVEEVSLGGPSVELITDTNGELVVLGFVVIFLGGAGDEEALGGLHVVFMWAAEVES